MLHRHDLNRHNSDSSRRMNIFYLCCGHFALLFRWGNTISGSSITVHYTSHHFCLHCTVDRNSIILLLRVTKLNPMAFIVLGPFKLLVMPCHASACKIVLLLIFPHCCRLRTIHFKLTFLSQFFCFEVLTEKQLLPDKSNRDFPLLICITVYERCWTRTSTLWWFIVPFKLSGVRGCFKVWRLLCVVLEIRNSGTVAQRNDDLCIMARSYAWYASVFIHFLAL